MLGQRNYIEPLSKSVGFELPGTCLQQPSAPLLKHESWVENMDEVWANDGLFNMIMAPIDRYYQRHIEPYC